MTRQPESSIIQIAEDIAQEAWSDEVCRDMSYITRLESHARGCGCGKCMEEYWDGLRSLTRKWEVPNEDQVSVEGAIAKYAPTKKKRRR